MNRKEFIKSIEKTYKRGVELVKQKNNDYTSKSPFDNFMFSSMVDVCIERGILVRMLDKISRISTLLDKAPDVQGESIEDSLIDLCNYSAILKAYLESKNERKTSN